MPQIQLTPQPLTNFTPIESVYGKLIVNRYCAHQAEHLIKTGMPHIQAELNTILSIVNTLPENCVVVDAGANAGLITIPVAQLIKKRGGIVYAFEVQRMMFYALCGSVALNDLDNVFVSQRGLGAARQSVTMDLPNYAIHQDFGQFSLVPGKAALKSEDHKRQETFEIIPLDELKLPRADFLKIDVEGMEIQALAGARETIQKNHPWCWIEYWMVKIDDIKAQFTGLPYTFYQMDKLNLLCVPADRVAGTQITITAPEV
jgi:FkbM family methyltransferase